MNKYKLFLSAGLFAAALTGCTDLNVDIESQYTDLPDTKEAKEAFLSNVFFKFRGPLGRRYMEAMTLSSDEYTSLAYSGNWVDGYAYAHPSYHAFSYEDATLDWMPELGKANVVANEIIASDKFTTDQKNSARAMRCFYTYIMMDNWGNVPLPDLDYCVEHGINTSKRAPRAEVAKWIEKELLEIYPTMTEETTGDNYGKPSKYMALALLAKLYINWPVYTADAVENYDAATATNEKLENCIKVCDEIIAAKKFALGPDEYRFKFNWDNTERVQNGTIKDFIYAAPYDTKDAQGMQWGRSHVYKDVKKMTVSYFGEFLNNSGGAYMTLTPECVSRFNLKNDQRNWMIAGLEDKDHNAANGQVYVYDPKTLLPTDTKALDKNKNPLIFTKDINVTGDVASNDVGDDLEGWRQGYRSTKWFICNNDYSNGRNQSNDVPIFRYADILLIKAEAMVRSGKSGAGQYFNEIRNYVGAPEINGDPTLNDIYEERGREFFDELWRRNDMVRFGHYEDEWFPHYKNNPNANFDKTHRIFPIHKQDLDIHDEWTQNNGY